MTVGGRATTVKQLLEVTRNRPYPHGMTESVDAAETALIAAINEISDDVQRYEVVKDLEARLDRSLKQIKAGVAKSLYDGRSWNQVGKMLGVTGSRAEQISRAAR